MKPMHYDEKEMERYAKSGLLVTYRSPDYWE